MLFVRQPDQPRRSRARVERSRRRGPPARAKPAIPRGAGISPPQALGKACFVSRRISRGGSHARGERLKSVGSYFSTKLSRNKGVRMRVGKGPLIGHAVYCTG
jgi:hypothetical protein